MMESWSLAEKEQGKFQAQLADFPHTFQLKDLQRLSPNQMKRLKSGLESALSVGYKTALETARARNLLAFALWHLGRPDDALQQLDLVLDMEDQRDNLVTLANKAVMLSRRCRLSNADDLLQLLRQIQADSKDFRYLVVKAKAELAFSYTRMGPIFIPDAVTSFLEVIPEARGAEEWLWKFGLALARRRKLRAQPQALSPIPETDTVNEQLSLLQLFQEIVQNSASVNLKAKAYAEMAILLHMVWRTPVRKEFVTKAGMEPKQACEIALQLDGDDNSVLCKCGRILRYVRETERSCELLEKALSIRPSATGYHHLGLTYKCLATQEIYKDVVKIPGYYRQLQREQHPRRGRDSDCQGPPQPFGQSGRARYDRGTSGQRRAAVAGTRANDGPTSNYSLNRDARFLQRVLKSPPKSVTRFSRNDRYVQEALHNFELSVTFSEGENTRALYDLALMQKSLGELAKALKSLQQILESKLYMFDVDYPGVYEQVGLIKREMAESETEEGRKKRLLQDSSTMLLMALKSASRLFSKSPGFKVHIREVWQSFPALLKEVEDSDRNTNEKLKEKAKLFQLIRDHKQSLDLLQKLQTMDQERANDPEYLKLSIEEFVATEQYEQALTFVELLKCTAQSLQLEEQYVLKIYVQAACHFLLQGSPTARDHFRSAFQDAMAEKLDEPSSSEDTDASEDNGNEDETWDVMILHAQPLRAQAINMTRILNDICGLRVSTIDRCAPPNKLELEGGLRVMRRSTMVVVLAGGKVSRDLRYWISNAVKRPSTVTLLVDGNHVPEMLKVHRSMVCPEELLHSCTTDDSEGTRKQAYAICKVFCFLAEIQDTDTAWA